MQATSRDWLNLIITATPVPDFAAQPVDVSLSPDQFNPTTDWFPAEHTAQGLRLMIGPGTDPGQLQPGSWHAWGRLTALGDGTLPVFYIGAFLIVGGTDLAPMPPVTIGQAALDAAMALESAARIAGDLAGAGNSRLYARPMWVPADCGAATLDAIGSTVASVALPSTGTAVSSLCQWFGEEGEVPSAIRFVAITAGVAVTAFRVGIYDDATGDLIYATANEAAAVGSAGEKVLDLLPVGSPPPMTYGQLIHVVWWNSATTGVFMARFAPLSSAVGNLGTTATHGRSMSRSGQADLPPTMSNFAGTTTVWFGQVLKA